MRVSIMLALLCAWAGAQTTPLSALIAEAKARNPALLAAAAQWHAAQAAVAPAGALPDPQIMVQQMSVGNPLPFAGYRTNNFAYIGVSASQTLPYPGKLKLRAGIAVDEAATAEARLAQQRAAVVQQVAAAYIQLQYLDRVRTVLTAQQQVLAAIARQAASQYGAGTGGQEAVLAAQLEQSKLLGELSTETGNEDAAQATLRALLGRAPSSPPVTPTPLRLTSAPAAPGLAQAPAEAVTAAQVKTAGQGVALARKNFKPDFQVQYMYQNTGPAFPDYYQWTVGLNLPIHTKSRLKPELERAAQLKLAAQEEQRSQRQQDEGALATLQARLDNDARLLRLDDGALLPQVRATAAARLTAYGAGQANIVGLLETERDLLAVQQQYWQTLADHEQALAQLGALTGVTYE